MSVPDERFGLNWHKTEANRLEDKIEALQQENEQLQAQAARMREALEYYADIKRWSEVNLIYVPSSNKARKALSATPTDYHNPADVAALKKAREVFAQVQHDIDGAECRDDLDGIKGYIDEALAAIDKIGGVK
jgi:hypothetical protein